MRKLSLGRPIAHGDASVSHQEWARRSLAEVERASHVEDPEHGQIEARLRAYVNALFAGLRRASVNNVPSPHAVTMKQIRAWASANGSPLYIYTIDDACPADVANATNILWLHSNSMTKGDNLYLFIQTTLSFTPVQMAVAFGQMGAYPS